MSKLINIFVIVVILSVIGLLCFFSCVLVSQKKEIWERIKFKGGKK